MYIINNEIMRLSLFDFMCLYIMLRLMLFMIYYIKLPNRYLLLSIITSLALVVLVVSGVFHGYYNIFIQVLVLFLLGLSSMFCSTSYCSSLKLAETDIIRIKRKTIFLIIEIISIAYILAFVLKNVVQRS
jgi:hypothetical protein